jgi:hypothetical protein
MLQPTIKPFLTNKGSNITKDIILEDNNKIINDQLQVANNFNNFFINVAKDIGNDNNLSVEEHPSIKIIKENKKEIPKLIFHEIENDFVSKQINKANEKKATRRDGISAKLLKFAKPAIVKPITNLINKSINNSIFPDKLKEAQVVPLFKKK